LNVCAGEQTPLTGVAVGSGAGTTTIDGTGVTLGSGATLTAGGNATVGGTLGVTGNTMLSTLSTSGAAMLDSLGVTNDATVSGTLGVTGNTMLTTLSTSGAAALNSLSVTNNATVGGTLGVTSDATVGGTLGVTGLTTTNGIDNSSGGISNAGAVSGVTTLSSTTIINSGAASINSLAVGAGGMTVAAGAPVSMGGNRVQDVATPVDPTDAANKAYVDSMSGNVEAQIEAQTARINSAFKEIDRNSEGIAVAMAMGGIALPQGKAFAIGANIGFYQDKQATAAQTVIRLNNNLTLNGGIGVGMSRNQVGGRVGLMAAW
jgi:hypothetical protein